MDERAVAPASRRYKALFWLALGLYFVLLGYDSVTRMRQFSPDSTYYIRSAEFAVQGKGLSHITFDVNGALKLDDLETPRPTTHWTPLYPILIAAFHALGAPAPETALLISVAAAGAIVLIVYALAKRLYGEEFARPAAAYVAASGVLFYIATYAWSETTGIAFLGLSFYLVSLSREGGRRYWLPVAAGVAACLAFWTRYALLPMAGVVGLLLIERKDWRATLRNWALFGGAYVLTALPVVIRTYMLTGTWLGSDWPDSNRGFFFNLLTLYVSWETSIVPRTLVSMSLQGLLMVVLLLAFLVSLLWRRVRRRVGSCLRGAFWAERRHVVSAWALGYFAYVLVYRSITDFAPLDLRIGSPGFVGFAIPMLAFATCLFGLGARGLRRLAWVFIAVGLTAVVKPLFAAPVDDYAALAQRSEYKDWIVRETTPRDLVVGEDLTDLAFLYPDRRVVLFYASSVKESQLAEEDFYALLAKHCGRYDRVFLVVAKHGLFPRYGRIEDEQKAKEDLRKRLLRTRGEFLADLVEGRMEGHPGVTLVKEVKDGYIFRVECPGKSP